LHSPFREIELTASRATGSCIRLLGKSILERFLPPRKDRAIKIAFPPINTFDDVLNAIGFIVNAAGQGKIRPSEGELLARTVESSGDL
jgi:hypothetical protein